MQAVGRQYDARAGIEAALQADTDGLGLGRRRKRKLPAQRVLLFRGHRAHNVLIWSRRWLAAHAPRLRAWGIVRLVREVWAIPGRVHGVGAVMHRVRLHPAHPRARDVGGGLAHLVLKSPP